MPSYLYKPGHILADKSGFVLKQDYYDHKYMIDPPKTMMNGNEPVRLNYISDNQEPMRHMALPPGSAPLDSKSKFRKITKEQGCIEIGDQTHCLTKPRKRIQLDKRQRRDDIRRSLHQLRNKGS
jgi:hypothetical protein